MLRYFKDLYNGIDCKYLLFWDNSPKAIAKITFRRGQLQKIEYLLLSADNLQSLSVGEGLHKLGYGGEGIDVIFFGPANIQLIRQIDDCNTDIPDWIIEHKSELLPQGIPEEEAHWDYAGYVIDENKYICFAVSRNNQILAVQSLLDKNGIRSNSIRPFLGLAIDIWGLKLLLHADTVFPLQIPGTFTSFETTPKGILCVTRANVASTDNTGIEYTSNITPVNTSNSESLIYLEKKADFLDNTYQRLIRHFKILANIVMIFSILVCGFGLFLAFKENGRIEKLEEMKFLEANLNSLNNQLDSLQQLMAGYDSCDAQKTNIAACLATLAVAKPENIWWRKVEYKMGSGISIEGLSVGESEASIYHTTLLKSGNLGDLKLGEITRYKAPQDSPIPSKFHDDLFRFKLDIGGM